MVPRPWLKGACCFCNVREHDECGTLYKTPDDQLAAHSNCMLFSPKLVTQNSPEVDSFGGFLLEDVKAEKKRGRRLKCSFCRQSGATIGCDVKKCKKSFHYPCAKKCSAELIADEKKGIYKIYCVRHKDKTSNGEEVCDDLDGANISTNDDITEDSQDDFSEDIAFDSNNENDGSLLHNKQTQNGVENTPKRNMLKRAKTNTLHGPSGKVTNCESSQVDVGENSPASTPSRILGEKHKFKSQDGSRTAKERTPLGKRRKLRTESDSSTSSTSTLAQIPVKAVPEGQMDGDQRVENENLDPQWIRLLSGYHARVTEQSHVTGQNTMKPRDFWQLCKTAKCTEALCNRIKTALESKMQRIQNQTASEDDYTQVFEVLMITGCLQTIATDLKKEIKDQKETLNRKQADLSRQEGILEDIIPTLNRPSTSDVFD